MNSTSPVTPGSDDKHPRDEDHPELTAQQSRLGLILFFVYLAAYGGFMGLSAFAPTLMARPVLAGMNLAITHGLGLILGAVVLALLYMLLATANARRFGEAKR